MRIIPHVSRGSVHPRWFLGFPKYFGILFDLATILGSLLLWRFFLPACTMITPVCLVVFDDLPWHCHSDLLNHRVRECTQSSVDPYEFILPAQMSFRT